MQSTAQAFGSISKFEVPSELRVSLAATVPLPRPRPLRATFVLVTSHDAVVVDG